MRHLETVLRGLGVLVLGGALASTAQRALAAGIEDTVSGTVALGRAANYARVNDFMATWQNPANLAIAPANVGLELRLPIFDACFDRARDTRTVDAQGNPLDPDMNGEPGIQYRADESFDEVCNDAAPLPAGNLGFTLKLSDSLGIGAGFFTPAGVGALKFGSARNPTFKRSDNEVFQTTTGGTLSPNRYLLTERAVLAGFLSIGIGYAPVPNVRVGVSLSSGFADVSYSNFAGQTPTALEEDVVNDVRVSDFFIPRATASIAYTPLDAIDVMGSFTWNDDIKATGHVDVTAAGIQGAPRKSCFERTDGRATPGPHCRIDDATLDVPYQRFEAVLALRYAARLRPRSDTLDPLAEERWDVEIDALWVNTSHVDQYALSLYSPDAPIEERAYVAFSGDPKTNAVALPYRAALPHNWKDTYGVRIGGDYSVLPDQLAVRAGFAFETRGVPASNMNIDYWPVQKATFSAGATWRVVPSIDVHAAFAYTVNETVDVALGEGRVREVVVIDPGLVANEGRYTSTLYTASIQGNYKF